MLFHPLPDKLEWTDNTRPRVETDSSRWNFGCGQWCQLVCTTRWMQEKVLHNIGVAYAMTWAIIGKYVLIYIECMTIQLYAKSILFIYHVMVY